MRGGRAAQMEQPIYAGEHGAPGGSDDEEAPLLSRSGGAEGEGETVSAELSRLRRENLMTSQELERVRAENERLRGGGGGAGAGAGGRGFDESRGRMMEEL